MTPALAIRIVSRLAVLYLLFWIITDLTSLPREALAIVHEWNLRHTTVRATDPFYLQSATLFLAANLTHITLWSALALWFYQFPPFLQRFLGIQQPHESSLSESPVPETTPNTLS